MKRANYLEKTFIFILTFSTLLNQLVSVQDGIFGDSVESFNLSKLLVIIGHLTDIVFMVMFTCVMYSINKQLILFFRQVEIRNYPSKFINTVLTAYITLGLNIKIMLLIEEHIEIPILYHYISYWLNGQMFPGLFLSVTLIFYWLADLNFEERQKSLRYTSEEKYNVGLQS